jgi:predicted transcriptional regulator of viral defense system
LKQKKSEITGFFDRSASKVLTHTELSEIVADGPLTWGLPESLTVREFVSFMEENTELNRVILAFPHRREIRFCWGDVSVYELAMRLKRGAYLTHYAAMAVHDLTDQIPSTIYVNAEQQPKPSVARELEQARIDIAFRSKPRVSRNVAAYGDYRICLLSGKYTGGLGVVDATGPDGVPVRVTGIDRTLIDIAVRPFYAGGIFEVLGAYRRARNTASVGRVVEFLKRLDYIYPYHQAIGFYFEKAGVYKEEDIARLREFPFHYDFYLCTQIRKQEYSKKWRLFYPKGF